ncbi:MAG: class I SAM-dependent methyltransferase [Thermoplasmata archaeon]|nr:class I SAM-dependent methyltransferase [Thermoplasmata archaeon]
MTILKENHYEKRFGIETNKRINTCSKVGLYADGYEYSAASYHTLEKLVRHLILKSDDICVDIGCGQGRIVCFLAMQNVKRVIGIEVIEELAKIAKENIKNMKIRPTMPVDIHTCDAAEFDYSECTIFIFFNPFGLRTLSRVVNNIESTVISHPRNIKIIYYGTKYRDHLDSMEWLIFEEKVKDTELYIWRNRINS